MVSFIPHFQGPNLVLLFRKPKAWGNPMALLAVALGYPWLGAPAGSSDQALQLYDQKLVHREKQRSDHSALPFTFARPEQKVRVIHIPKTAGASLQADLLANDFTFSPLRSSAQEMCYEAIQIPHGFHVVFFRDPREQIFSLYLECRFDVWGNRVTQQAAHRLQPGEKVKLMDDCEQEDEDDSEAGSSNPSNIRPSPAPEGVSRAADMDLLEGEDTFPRSGNISTDFVEWLDYFLHSDWSPDGVRHTRNDAYNDYGCYNPWNMQTRAMTCSGRSELHHLHSRASRVPPTKDVGIARVDAAEFVGISELYDESWCLLQFQLSRKLPAVCTCDVVSPCTLGHSSQDGVRLAECESQHARRRHAVPPHEKASSLGESTTRKLDTLSVADDELYLAAMSRVLLHLRALETHTNVKLICAGRLLQLMETTAHIEGSQEVILNSTTLGLAHVSATSVSQRSRRR